MEGDEYLFALCNSAFLRSFAPEDINGILQKDSFRLSAYFNLIMPDNRAAVTKDYGVPSKEELNRCEEQVQAKLHHSKKVITNREMFIEKDDGPPPFPLWVDKVLRPLIVFLVEKHTATVLKGAVYADSNCCGCKICQQVCPADRIFVKDGRPLFDCKKTCFGCCGCINFCPVGALQVGSKWYNRRSYMIENGR